jgi:pimeloyl-ACP methyl ester carboxylesterase
MPNLSSNQVHLCYESTGDGQPYAELVVILGAHHATPIEQPEAFNAALKPFLANVG